MSPCETCDAAQDGRCYVQAVRQPVVSVYLADGVWTAAIEVADAGTMMPQHAHSYEHLTMVARGSVRVFRVGDEPWVVSAPAGVTIPAKVMHQFETLTDDVLLLCIHNTMRSGSVEIAAENGLTFVEA